MGFQDSKPTSLSDRVKDEENDQEMNLSSSENASSFHSDRYGSFRSEYSYIYVDGEKEVLHRPRRADNYYGIRQEYLRSYTFTRDTPTRDRSARSGGEKPEKLKDRVKRLKAILGSSCIRPTIEVVA
ncbi:hypothetical protein R1sor_025243 [Riccia sorocarpa]|uniref:Uncharacterized protein n=1 Tax=Riccia sorocarpa TaxID=122646 RepID=A0ABD3GBA9_9MARC